MPYGTRMADAPTTSAQLAELEIDLEIKLAYQERLIRELDALVRTFGTKVDTLERRVKELEQEIRSPEVPVGPANERPPHY
jgi:uncharacterized coiled-coil protein SlyX